MEWVIRNGNTALGVGYTVGLLVGRLEYLASGKTTSSKKLIEESLDFAKALQGWVKENEPPYVETRKPWVEGREYIGARAGGKAGPMSDG